MSSLFLSFTNEHTKITAVHLFQAPVCPYNTVLWIYYDMIFIFHSLVCVHSHFLPHSVQYLCVCACVSYNKVCFAFASSREFFIVLESSGARSILFHSFYQIRLIFAFLFGRIRHLLEYVSNMRSILAHLLLAQQILVSRVLLVEHFALISNSADD